MSGHQSEGHANEKNVGSRKAATTASDDKNMKAKEKSENRDDKDGAVLGKINDDNTKDSKRK